MHAAKLKTANKKSPSTPKKDRSSPAKSNPLLQQVLRMGNTPNPKEHAAVLKRAPANQQASKQQLLLLLQQKYGNNYVNQVMQLTQPNGGETKASPTQKPVVQAKLTVNPAGDKYEQEADRVADNVVQRMNEPATGDDRDKIQHQEMSPQKNKEEEKTAQTKPEITSLQRQAMNSDMEQEEDKTAQTKSEQQEESKEEEEKTAQTKPEISSLQRQEMNSDMEQEEDKTAQTKSEPQEESQEEEEQTAQTKPEITSLQRQEVNSDMEQEEDKTAQTKSEPQEESQEEEEQTAQTKPEITSLQRQEMNSDMEQEEDKTAQTKSEPQEESQEEEEKTAQTKPEITSLQRQEMNSDMEQEEDKTAQTKPEPQETTSEDKEERTVQTKPQSNAKKQQLMAQEKQSQAKNQDEQENKLLVQMKSATKSRSKKVAPADLESSVQKEKGRGQPISDKVRGKLEQGFGADFSDVRIHTDTQSDRLNQSIQARAFTTEQDIFFRQGAYDPSSKQGQQLLAHELTHVVQQSGGAVQAKSDVNQAADNQIQTKISSAPSSVSQPKIQRKENPDEKTDLEQQPEPSQPEQKADAGTAEQPQPPADSNPEANQPPADSGTPNQPPAASDESGSNPQATSETRDSKDSKDEKAPTSSEDDPAFQEVVNATQELATQQQEHPPGTEKADEAQAAAEPPTNEVESKAQANQVEEMQQAETPEFDAGALKEKLMERIADITPKTLEEAEDFKNNNQLDSVKGELNDNVKQEKDASQGQLEEKTEETPDTSGIEPKPVEALPQQDSEKAPKDTNAQKAAPKPKGESEVEAPLQEDSQKLDQQLAENNVTEEQLQKSNEPEFQAALDSKQEAQTHAEQAPPKYRRSEQDLIAKAEATAVATAKEKSQGMQDVRTQQFDGVRQQQEGTKGKDEEARAKIANDINQIYEDTKTEVETILSDLDTKVIQAFDEGANEAKKAFEDYVGDRMEKYKEERYGEWWEFWNWDERIGDAVFGLPDEVNVFYEEGRDLFIDRMDGVIDNVVQIMSEGLTAAKTEINNGKKEVQNYVDQLPDDLKAVGQEAATEVEGKFDELEQSVNNKQDELINTLANKYQENLDAVDARIEEMKEANKGLLQKAIEFIIDVVGQILEMFQLLMQVLARVAHVVGQILLDPIGFLGNLIEGLTQGFANFITNIQKHLQQGLISWLTGTMASAGIEMPETFDLPGIFSLVVQLLGFTPETIEERVMERAEGGEQDRSSPSPQKSGQTKGSNKSGSQNKTEQTQKTGNAEQDKTANAPSSEQSTADNRSMENNNQADAGIDVLNILSTQGIIGLWEVVQDKVGDIKAMVFDQIQDFLIETVIKAGIEWIISIFVPGAGFIKACKAIFQIIKFFIERAKEIIDLINAVLDSVEAIVKGAIGEAAKKVEEALAKSIPLVIELLANLLGLGGLADKVQEIIEKVRATIEKAIDWVIEQGAKAARKVGNKVKDSKFGQKRDGAVESPKHKGDVTSRGAGDKKDTSRNKYDEKRRTEKDKFGKDRHKGKDKPDERTRSEQRKDNKDKETKDGKSDKRTMQEKQNDLRKAVAEAEQVMKKPEATPEIVKAKLPNIKSKYRLKSAKLLKDKNKGYYVQVEINPVGETIKTWFRLDERQKFNREKFQLRNWTPSTGNGKFDADYNPKTGKLKITIKVHFNFKDSDAYTKVAINPQETKWTKKGKQEWGKSFEEAVLSKWSKINHITCNKPGFDDIVVKPKFNIKQVKESKADWKIDVTKAFMEKGKNPRMRAGGASGVEASKITGMFQEFDTQDKIKNPHLVEQEYTTNIIPAYERDRERLSKRLSNLDNFKFKTGKNELFKESESRLIITAKSLSELRKDSYLADLHPLIVEFAQSDSPVKERFDTIKNTLKNNGVNNDIKYIKTSTSISPDEAKIKPKDDPDTIKQDYKKNWSRNTAAHEFGHMIGLLDEYFPAVAPSLIENMKKEGVIESSEGNVSEHAKQREHNQKDKQAAYTKLLDETGLRTPTWARPSANKDEKSTSLMSGGFELLKQHSVTIWEALTEMTKKYVNKENWKL
ncbi:DUF4157 domain-containing protein [Pleurocapsa sp. PCC 7319]|uniref:eCIS core domain-containing protein n=1 Tax=Pleurocapsa sp. PCC 7319 TaxID=118161 RepID=UPI000347EF8C|nr:DUF4157 domain-containing protein [Pleurocapsa sp. PCC 7319]